MQSDVYIDEVNVFIDAVPALRRVVSAWRLV
jgi:hypothetical protein